MGKGSRNRQEPEPVLAPDPPPQQQEIPITREIIDQSMGTACHRNEDGAILSFIVLEEGQPIRRSYIIGPEGKQRILTELSGGLQVATPADLQ